MGSVSYNALYMTACIEPRGKNDGVLFFSLIWQMDT